MVRAELKQLLRDTFPTAPFSADRPIAAHECEECRGIRVAFADQSPFLIPRATLADQYGSLVLLTPEAFQHFLPAYLDYAIDETESLVAEFIRYYLGPAEGDEFYLERFRLFSDAEKRVVFEVMEFLATRDPFELYGEYHDRARRYWGPVR